MVFLLPLFYHVSLVQVTDGSLPLETSKVGGSLRLHHCESCRAPLLADYEASLEEWHVTSRGLVVTLVWCRPTYELVPGWCSPVVW